MKIQIKDEERLPRLYLGEKAAGALTNQSGETLGLVQDGQELYLRAQEVRLGETVEVRYQCEGWSVVDRLEPAGDGLLRCKRTWNNLTALLQKAALVFEVYRTGPVESYLIPAVNYNGNAWGAGSEPKGLYDLASPGSPGWVFGGDRASVPACTITTAQGIVLGLYGLPELANQSGCALKAVASRITPGMVHQLWWPLQELPRTYVGRDLYQPGIHQEVEIASGGSLTREVLISLSPAADGPFDYRAVLDGAWKQFTRPVPAQFSPRQLWDLGIRFAKESLWYERESFRGFVLGRMLEEGEWVLPTWNLAEIGWCGQNATYAAMMLQDFLWNQDEDSWNKGETALNCWIEQCSLPNGLFFTHIDDVLAGSQEARLETCNLGGGAYAYLLAAELAERAGRPRPSWRQFGLDLCDFFVRNALPDGRFGRYWRQDGQLLEAEGTVGSWIVWPLLKAFQHTGRSEYLQSAQRGFTRYCEQDLAQFTITAGALDTDCIDKEGAFPLLMSGLDLYEITKEQAYLRQAEKAALYLATWQWHYSLSYPAGTAAAQIGYETFGGTSVSVQHHHLDPWGVLIGLGWLRLGKLTGNPIWTERGAAAWRQGSYGVSDGTVTIDGITRPAGGQDEGFLHTRWGRTVGGVSNWLVAWPGAFRLFVLQQWTEWKDLE